MYDKSTIVKVNVVMEGRAKFNFCIHCDCFSQFNLITSQSITQTICLQSYQQFMEITKHLKVTGWTDLIVAEVECSSSFKIVEQVVETDNCLQTDIPCDGQANGNEAEIMLGMFTHVPRAGGDEDEDMHIPSSGHEGRLSDKHTDMYAADDHSAAQGCWLKLDCPNVLEYRHKQNGLILPGEASTLT